MRKEEYFTKIKETQENVQREMHKQMDLLERAYLIKDKTHFERVGLKQYGCIFGIFVAAVVLLSYLFYQESNTYVQQFLFGTLIVTMMINLLYFIFDAILCWLYKNGKDNQCIWEGMCCCQKIFGYTMLVICAEVTFWWILASLIFKRIHMEKLQENSVSVFFSFVMSLEATFVLGIGILRCENIDIFLGEANAYFCLTIILLTVFWIVYRRLLRWCCTHIGIAEDFDLVVEETKVLLYAVFLVLLLIVYGIEWSTPDENGTIMQCVANAITVALLADTIVMKARENE